LQGSGRARDLRESAPGIGQGSWSSTGLPWPLSPLEDKPGETEGSLVCRGRPTDGPPAARRQYRLGDALLGIDRPVLRSCARSHRPDAAPEGFPWLGEAGGETWGALPERSAAACLLASRPERIFPRPGANPDERVASPAIIRSSRRGYLLSLGGQSADGMRHAQSSRRTRFTRNSGAARPGGCRIF